MLLRVLPLLEDRKPAGALILMRDVTDLRRRDRMLLSKDATIREIHHRVKNNLQTIASLLRLQGRRLDSPEARQALAESERRIRSIAIVHETLSREAGDVVEFSEIVRRSCGVVEETVVAPTRAASASRWRATRASCPGEVATPLAVVLNELMQNAVDHAFPRATTTSRCRQGRSCGCPGGEQDVLVEVIDDGVGLPEGFSLDRSQGPRPLDRAGARHRRARPGRSRCTARTARASSVRIPSRRPPRRRWSSPLPEPAWRVGCRRSC